MALCGVIVVTGRQLKAARTLAGWTQEELARKARISAGTIKRSEAKPGPVRARYGTLERIVAVLEKAGVKFSENEGVSFHPPRR